MRRPREYNERKKSRLPNQWIKTGIERVYRGWMWNVVQSNGDHSGGERHVEWTQRKSQTGDDAEIKELAIEIASIRWMQRLQRWERHIGKRQDQPGTYHLNYQSLDQFVAISIAHSLISASPSVWPFLYVHSIFPLSSTVISIAMSNIPNSASVHSLNPCLHPLVWWSSLVPFIVFSSSSPWFPFQCHVFLSFPFQFVWQSACAVNICIWFTNFKVQQ